MNLVNKDVRWVQSLSNFQKAFDALDQAIKLAMEKELSDIEKEGLIQRFEYNWELAWKTVQAFYKYLGGSEIQGSRDAFLIAYNRGLIKDEDHAKALMESIKSRNDTVHSYNKKTADEIFCAIRDKYYSAFKALLEALLKEKKSRNL